MLNHQQRSQVGLFVFIITMSAIVIAGAGYLMGKPTLDWLVVVITSGLASLATAWRPGSTPTVDTGTPPAIQVQAPPAPLPDVPPINVTDIPPMTGPTGPEHGLR